MNPYTQFLTDEASGLQYINPKWEAWEEGKREGRREGLELMLDWDDLSIRQFTQKYPGFKDCETASELVKEAKAKWLKEAQQ
jgi:hypothetical protein